MKNFLCSLRLRESRTDSEREESGSNDKRTNMDSDFGRVVFSSACRRMHDKTQVFPLTTDDNIHSRLTHSLEVMTISRTFTVDLINNRVFCNTFKPINMDDVTFYRELESLLSTICLSHDMGNPPFGHFGEATVQSYFTKLFDKLRTDIAQKNYQNPVLYGLLNSIDNDEKASKECKQKECIATLADYLNKNNKELLDFTSFDGNAQGFRVLTKTQFLSDLYGLNLTYASLASFLKYPNSGDSKKFNNIIALHKHGVFTTEKSIMSEVMNGCNVENIDEDSFCRHPFSFIMEACDTICYLVMDMEDATNKGWITYDRLINLANDNPYFNEVLEKSKEHFDKNAPDRKKIVQLRVDLINYFVQYAIKRFIDNMPAIVAGSFYEELLYDDQDKDCLAKFIGNFSKMHIYSQREIECLELTGDAVITGIIENYMNYLFNADRGFRMRGKNLISHSSFYTTLQEHLQAKKSDETAWEIYPTFDPKDLSFGERIRIIRDFVSGMTDKFALSQYQKLNGQKI